MTELYRATPHCTVMLKYLVATDIVILWYSDSLGVAERPGWWVLAPVCAPVTLTYQSTAPPILVRFMQDRVYSSVVCRLKSQWKKLEKLKFWFGLRGFTIYIFGIDKFSNATYLVPLWIDLRTNVCLCEFMANFTYLLYQ